MIHLELSQAFLYYYNTFFTYALSKLWHNFFFKFVIFLNNILAQSESVVQTHTDPDMITQQQQNSWSLSTEKFRYYNVYIYISYQAAKGKKRPHD
jgi:hypothetical protein